MPDEDIRDLAYQLWEADGCKEGQELQYWYEAERRLRTPSDRTYGDQGDGVDPMEEPEKAESMMAAARAVH